jgi:hypothetical protein
MVALAPVNERENWSSRPRKLSACWHGAIPAARLTRTGIANAERIDIAVTVPYLLD